MKTERWAEQYTVLIPAAGRVPEGVLSLSSVTTPAMIPVAGRPVVHWTLSYLTSLGLRRFVIAVPERGGFIEEFVQSVFGGVAEVEFVKPTMQGRLGHTVRELSAKVQTPSALVVLGDTHFQFQQPDILDSPHPFVLVGSVEESERWCIAETSPEGDITRLHDKSPDLRVPLQALVGVYGFPDAPALARAAEEVVNGANAGGRPAEMSAVLDRLRESGAMRAVPAGVWLDCGNPDRQASSHRALLQSRAFNELSVDPVMGTITKRSRHAEKFIDEIDYLRLLPKELQVLFPRVLDFSVDWKDPYVTLEYYGYPSLSEMFVFENIAPGVWEGIFRHLKLVLEQGFMRFRRPLSGRAVEEMYLTKTRERLSALSGPSELLRLVRHEGELVVNGKKVKNLPVLWPRLQQEIDALTRTALGTVVHGDLCFSNILYDPRSRIFKLIDPRGSFGRAGLTGDPRYDVAKLYHSVRGRYDFIVNDLFRVTVNGLNVELELRGRPLHDRVREQFDNVFFESFSKREISLITALLFASMPPLHYDHPKRQLAMYANALLLLDEALEMKADL